MTRELQGVVLRPPGRTAAPTMRMIALGCQVRRTFQKIGKPSGTPVMSWRNAVGICATPSG